MCLYSIVEILVLLLYSTMLFTTLHANFIIILFKAFYIFIKYLLILLSKVKGFKLSTA